MTKTKCTIIFGTKGVAISMKKSLLLLMNFRSMQLATSKHEGVVKREGKLIETQHVRSATKSNHRIQTCTDGILVAPLSTVLPNHRWRGGRHSTAWPESLLAV